MCQRFVRAAEPSTFNKNKGIVKVQNIWGRSATDFFVVLFSMADILGRIPGLTEKMLGNGKRVECPCLLPHPFLSANWKLLCCGTIGVFEN